MAQAGVTLGFAALVGERFPEFGPMVRTAVLAVVALNQIAGPVLFRIGLARAGEFPRKKHKEAPRPGRAPASPNRPAARRRCAR